MKVIKLTTEEILNNDVKLYNESEWKAIIARYSKHEGVQFFMSPKNDIYAYDRFFAVYKINEGLILLNNVSYSSSLSNAGFTRAIISENEITFKGFGTDGKERVTNTKEGRKWLVDNLCKYGVVVTTL